ncbi:restriction endonuclease subunit S [Paenibacillus sp. p3-SID1389]|uniref:restriction endonuclease subunit S n=1 Tax=Paenibacillus sp. p3-SID1389 TaxID=2916364 RepID=UPI0021A6FA3E|nr:restriction endonuclease subunit S [Paenibacillus sp. p3-SID1389]MCT2195996.1 restriction endonuclease subunit S [Paenibacillus sp. p3-SID1389]
MSFEWKIKKVDEIKADISNAIAMGPFGSNIKTENFVARGVPVIRGINLSKGKLYEEEYVYITEEKADELKSSNAFPGDLVFTHRGTLGQVGIIPFNSKYRRYVVSQSQMKLTCNTKKVNPLFVYYFFKSNIGQHALLMNTSTTGVPAISRPVTSLKNIEIPLPALDEQQRIVDILNALDDKIELNNAINKNLEEMAQAIFKRWFVDFEFPNENGEPYKSSGGEFEESELGLIPRGWKLDCLDGIADYLNGLAMQKYRPDGEQFIPVIKIRELNQGRTNSDSDKASPNIDKKYIVNNGDVLFSWSGTLDIKLWCGGIGGLNQHLFKVTSKNYDKWFYYYWTKHHIERFRRIASDKATTMGHIKRNDLKEAKVLIPDPNNYQKATDIFKPIVDKMIQLSVESFYLERVRDTLLPKLMSGEIRVPVEQDHSAPDLPMAAESSAIYQP